MLTIPQWLVRNEAAIKDMKRKRSAAGKLQPVRLGYVSVDSDRASPGALGGRWLLFTAAVGPRLADVWWLRICDHLAQTGDANGVIRANRKTFARRVLSTDEDDVEDALGELVYDALVSSGLGVASEPAQEPRAEPRAAKADDPRAEPLADTAAEPASDAAGVPAAEPAALYLVPGKKDSPPLSSPEPGEGAARGSSAGAASDPAAVPRAGLPKRVPLKADDPLTAGEAAAARALAAALRENRMKPPTSVVGSAEKHARAVQLATTAVATARSDADRAAAKEKLERLHADRKRAIEDLVAALDGTSGPEAARRFVQELLPSAPEDVRIAAHADARLARGAERDRRRGVAIGDAPLAANA